MTVYHRNNLPTTLTNSNARYGQSRHDLTVDRLNHLLKLAKKAQSDALSSRHGYDKYLDHPDLQVTGARLNLLAAATNQLLPSLRHEKLTDATIESFRRSLEGINPHPKYGIDSALAGYIRAYPEETERALSNWDGDTARTGGRFSSWWERIRRTGHEHHGREKLETGSGERQRGPFGGTLSNSYSGPDRIYGQAYDPSSAPRHRRDHLHPESDFTRRLRQQDQMNSNRRHEYEEEQRRERRARSSHQGASVPKSGAHGAPAPSDPNGPNPTDLSRRLHLAQVALPAERRRKAIEEDTKDRQAARLLRLGAMSAEPKRRFLQEESTRPKPFKGIPSLASTAASTVVPKRVDLKDPFFTALGSEPPKPVARAPVSIVKPGPTPAPAPVPVPVPVVPAPTSSAVPPTPAPASLVIVPPSSPRPAAQVEPAPTEDSGARHPLTSPALILKRDTDTDDGSSSDTDTVVSDKDVASLSDLNPEPGSSPHWRRLTPSELHRLQNPSLGKSTSSTDDAFSRTSTDDDRPSEMSSAFSTIKKYLSNQGTNIKEYLSSNPKAKKALIVASTILLLAAIGSSAGSEVASESVFRPIVVIAPTDIGASASSTGPGSATTGLHSSMGHSDTSSGGALTGDGPGINVGASDRPDRAVLTELEAASTT